MWFHSYCFLWIKSQIWLTNSGHLDSINCNIGYTENPHMVSSGHIAGHGSMNHCNIYHTNQARNILVNNLRGLNSAPLLTL